MKPSQEQVHAFLSRYGRGFPHAEQIGPILDGGAAKVDLFENASVAALRVTYRARAATLASRRPPTNAPKTLAREVRALWLALEDAKEQPVRIWHIALEEGRTYSMFELVNDRALLGVVSSFDRRVTAAR